MKPLLTTKVSQHCPSGLKSSDFKADKAGRWRGAGRSGMRWECHCCASHPSPSLVHTARGGEAACPAEIQENFQSGPWVLLTKCRYHRHAVLWSAHHTVSLPCVISTSPAHAEQPSHTRAAQKSAWIQEISGETTPEKQLQYASIFQLQNSDSRVVVAFRQGLYAALRLSLSGQFFLCGFFFCGSFKCLLYTPSSITFGALIKDGPWGGHHPMETEDNKQWCKRKGKKNKTKHNVRFYKKPHHLFSGLEEKPVPWPWNSEN